MMTLDEAINYYEDMAFQKDLESGFDTDNDRYAMTDKERADCKECAEKYQQVAEWLKELKELRKQTSWIPLISRKPTQEEKDDYFAQHGEELCYMLENEMPLDGQDVLVSVNHYVSEDVFDEDCYTFENYDIEHVDAWMPLPKPYKVEKKCCSDCKHHTNGEIHGVTPCGSCGDDKKNFEQK